MPYKKLHSKENCMHVFFIRPRSFFSTQTLYVITTILFALALSTTNQAQEAPIAPPSLELFHDMASASARKTHDMTHLLFRIEMFPAIYFTFTKIETAILAMCGNNATEPLATLKQNIDSIINTADEELAEEYILLPSFPNGSARADIMSTTSMAIAVHQKKQNQKYANFQNKIHGYVDNIIKLPVLEDQKADKIRWAATITHINTLLEQLRSFFTRLKLLRNHAYMKQCVQSNIHLSDTQRAGVDPITYFPFLQTSLADLCEPILSQKDASNITAFAFKTTYDSLIALFKRQVTQQNQKSILKKISDLIKLSQMRAITAINTTTSNRTTSELKRFKEDVAYSLQVLEHQRDLFLPSTPANQLLGEELAHAKTISYLRSRRVKNGKLGMIPGLIATAISILVVLNNNRYARKTRILRKFAIPLGLSLLATGAGFGIGYSITDAKVQPKLKKIEALLKSLER
jgi:hypothetical protein